MGTSHFLLEIVSYFNVAAPKGNKNAVGHDGSKSGRKSAYEEFNEAKWASEVWNLDQKRTELQAKIESGVYSVRDMFLYKCLSGEVKLLLALSNKLLPDKIDMTSEGSPIRYINVVRASDNNKPTR